MLVLRRTRYLVPNPPEGPVLHVATYFRRTAGWRQARDFSKFNRQVETQIESTPGALAYSLQRLAIGRDFWTLSLWSDQRSMRAFVGAGSHRAAADWLDPATKAAGTYTQWEAPQPSLRWAEAYERLGLPPPRGHVLAAPTSIPVGWRAEPR